MSRALILLLAAVVLGAVGWWWTARERDEPTVRALAPGVAAVEATEPEPAVLRVDAPEPGAARVAASETTARPTDPLAQESRPARSAERAREQPPGPTGTVTVLVEGPEGLPVAGAQVRALGGTPQERIADRVRSPERTDAQGRARLTGVRLGEAVVVASAEGFAEGASEPLQLTVERLHAEARVVLGRGGRVEGRLLDVDGAPASGVRLSMHGRGSFLLRAADTAADGSFAFERVPAGRYTLWTRAEGDDARRVPQQRLELEVREGETTTVRFVDQRDTHVVLSGRVLRDGEPCAASRLNVSWRDPGGGTLLLQAETDAEGRFALTLGEPGAYRAQVVQRDESGGFRGSVDFEIDVPPVPAFDIELAFWTGSLVGRVLDGAGEPAGGARVQLFGYDGTTGSYRATADGDGRYEVVDVAVGTYRVFAQVAGSSSMRIGVDGDPSTAQVEVVAGATTSVRDLRLPVTTSIEGRVTSAAGEPVAAADVHVSGGPPTAYRALGTRSDPSGAFVVPDVEPGDYWLRASWHDGTSSWKPINVAGHVTARVELALEPGARLSLRFEGLAEPSGRVLVNCRDDLGRSCGYASLEGGAGTLGPLPPGTYHLRAHRGPQELLAEETVTLAPGEERTLILRQEE